MGNLAGRLLGLLLCLQCSMELQGVLLKFTNVTCEVKDASFGIVNYCEIQPLSPTKNILRMRYSFAEPIVDNILFRIQVMTRSSESHDGVSDWQPFLSPLNIDVCRFLKNRYNHLAKMAFKLIEGHSNFNHTCPFLEKAFVIDDLTNTEVSTRLRGIPVARGFYSLYTKWFRGNKTLVRTNFYFEVLSN